MSFTPQLLSSDIEDDLRAAVRDLLAKRVAPPDLIGAYDGVTAPGIDADLAEMGVAGLLVPEDLGGAGAGAAVAGVVAEELGAACAAGSFLTSAGIATATALAADATALASDLASGERTAAVVVPFSVDPHGPAPVVAVADGALSGTVRSVAGVLGAEVLLVLGTDGALRAVPASDARIEPVSSLDMTRQVADVTFDGARGTVLASDGAAAVRAGLLTGAALLAAEQAGTARWCVTTTVEYLKQRKQFGRVVGGFQAIKHRLAELYADAESAAAAARSATVTLAELGPEDPETVIAVAVAAAYCSDLAVRAAEEAVQLHGGIGMTWEAPVHLYLKRAKADQIGLGTPGRHRAALAGLIDLPA
ncbi:acyl-CoA/acyl-ACP dehydrogenase [Tsukamurella tyrosinosolvens]|uniref:acyl-CoA dehydrogenase family protein n=1 Tax=Tsukamurella tyrosinosolvens TaxID=57704 RepID=UPI00079769AF|nr:acyl-CoA dehydrogenase family protein [Tsukamurella tyrosinosolvens]AUN40294.1 acyl-CoA dehydrogenase [Tsukamurella tyrosinosolvens]KXP05743.1 acyl-CoA dehydrogenase [Tsukamurella tyrosinosolvens]KZL95562.1 acyl-CoA dehydrogenase [Tsukamurella tyrosinosolvens]MCA4993654.1 acyl-CoA/acyl-ACP dehydrogenase [Tsukamurella tyrosinosolvens]QRY83031.1 acyl-CoA/acyl-ACP dehydrogenase [Tsukamurella tyrosinosolvens]